MDDSVNKEPVGSFLLGLHKYEAQNLCNIAYCNCVSVGVQWCHKVQAPEIRVATYRQGGNNNGKSKME